MNNKIKFVLASSLIFFNIFTIRANEKSDAFIVDIFDKKIKVLSVSKYTKGLNVIISNRMLTKLVGQVVTDGGKSISFVAIAPGKYQSVTIDEIKEQRVFFVPLVPAFQEVELVLGKKSYEIPPKR